MKKLGTLVFMCILFSGAGYDNTASIIPKPIKEIDTIQVDTVRVKEMREKIQELDTLLMELKTYEKY